MKTINKINMSAVSPHIDNWETINWNKINEYVKKLRQRIFRAEQLGQKRKVRKLQRLMIRSKANLLLSIKKVTQINKGRKTAGIDGEIVITSKDRIRLLNLLGKYNIIFTKLDEPSALGNILNIKLKTNANLSYVTSGQTVPDDISVIDAQKLAKNLLGGGE